MLDIQRRLFEKLDWVVRDSGTGRPSEDREALTRLGDWQSFRAALDSMGVPPPADLLLEEAHHDDVGLEASSSESEED